MGRVRAGTLVCARMRAHARATVAETTAENHEREFSGIVGGPSWSHALKRNRGSLGLHSEWPVVALIRHSVAAYHHAEVHARGATAVRANIAEADVRAAAASELDHGL